MKKEDGGRKLDFSLVTDPANVRALTGINCDNAVLVCEGGDVCDLSRMRLYTDFRFLPMVRRLAPQLRSADLKKLPQLAKGGRTPRRIGFESSISVSALERFKQVFPRARFVDVEDEVLAVRSVKTRGEIERICAAVALNDAIWDSARKTFRPGMTELEMARVIKLMMVEAGEGEAFETIVCVGANAAECHHIPDGTVWDGREPVLVDMGVKLDGFCSDMTRCFGGVRRGGGLYAKIYSLVRRANLAAIAAVRPGMTCRALDKVARDVIAQAGYGRYFGHSLGHGVGLEIHERPFISRRSRERLEPGMIFTIEPGVYLEGQLGVRIEDVVLVTADGCEVLTSSAK